MSGPEHAPKFELAQARELAEALAQHGADYLFLGKAGAILLGYPGTTLDLDLFAPKDAENARRCIAALRDLDFQIDLETEQALLSGKDFVQIKDGPFDVDITTHLTASSPSPPRNPAASWRTFFPSPACATSSAVKKPPTARRTSWTWGFWMSSPANTPP